MDGGITVRSQSSYNSTGGILVVAWVAQYDMFFCKNSSTL
jgi:hypothetical protein